MKLPLRTKRWDDVIAALDAERDAQAIVVILANHVFPLEILVALELAQLRTFSIPSISRLLHRTRQYEAAGQKRLDDTRAILTEIAESKEGSTQHAEMVTHLNRIHAQYRISNDDYLYTLSTFVFDPWRFIERFGHRPLTEKEKQAFYFFYRRLGEAMHMEAIPPSFDAFLEWKEEYERRAQRYSEDNEHVARGMLTTVQGLLPAPLRPALEPLLASLIKEPAFLASIGFKPAAPSFQRAVHGVLYARRRLSRRVNRFEHTRFWDHPSYTRYPSYPSGYERTRLGPAKVIAILERQGAAAPLHAPTDDVEQAK